MTRTWQINSPIYGCGDRMRGIEGTHYVRLINPDETRRANLQVGQAISLVGDAQDGVERSVFGLKVVPFPLPDGCLSA